MSAPAVAMAAVAAVPRSSHTKESIRHGPAGKHVQTGVCVHTTHTLPTPLSPLPGNVREYKKGEEAASIGGRAPLSLREACRGVPESSCSTRGQANRPGVMLLLQSPPSPSDRPHLEWGGMRAVEALSSTRDPCREGATSESEAPPRPCPSSPPGASRFQVQAQPFRNLRATLAFNEGELRSSTSILSIQTSGSPALIMWPRSQN